MRTKLGALLALAALSGTAVWAGADSTYEIKLLDKSWTPPAGISAEARQSVTQAASALAARGQEKVHVLVQLYQIPDESEKNALWRDGLDLGTYVSGQAWIAAVPVADVAKVVTRNDVRSLALWDAARKVHPRLQAGDVAPWAVDPARPAG